MGQDFSCFVKKKRKGKGQGGIKKLGAMIPANLHARVRLEQEQSGKTLSEFVEQLITDYYKMKDLLKKSQVEISR